MKNIFILFIFISLFLGCTNSDTCSMKDIELNNYQSINRSDWDRYERFKKIIEIQHYETNKFDIRLRKVRKFQSTNAIQMIFDSRDVTHVKYSYIICLDSGKIISATVIKKALSLNNPRSSQY